MRSLLALVLACGLFVVAGCAQVAQPESLTVYAAASLTDALDAVIEASAESRPEAPRITTSVGSSAALRTQIEQGAPADLFLSADTSNPQALVDAGLAAGAVVPFARNRLVIVVPRGNPAGITSAADLARDGVCVIGAGENVPVSRYATELIEQLARQPGSPRDFVARYTANICSREDDVRAVLTKIELNEGDAAVVYATDALASDAETVELPAGIEVLASYGGVVLERSSAQAQARELLTWIAGAEGREVMARFGFTPAP